MRGKDLLESMEFIDDALVEEAFNLSVPVRRTQVKTIAGWGMAAACVIVVGASAMALWSHRNTKMSGAGMTSEMAMDGAVADEAAPEEAMPQAADTAGAMPGGGDVSGNADALNGNDAGYNTAGPKQMAEDSEQEAGVICELPKQESAGVDYKIISDYYGEKYAEIDYKAPEKGEVIRFYYLDETIRYYTEQENTIETNDNSVYAYEVVIELFGDVLDDDVGMHYGVLYGDSDEASEKIKQEYSRLVELGYAVRLSDDFRLTGVLTKVEMDTFQASPEYGYVFRFENE